nr:OB-fold domain-containing protein [Nakamurella lactea]
MHHPREACPGCLSTELQWRESAGRGTVHAVSVHYRPFAPMTAEDCPYAVAFVDLEDGVRFLANVTADDLEAIRVGDPVSLQWSPIADGYHLPVFHANAH